MTTNYQNIVMYGNATWNLDSLGNSAQQLSRAFLQLGYRVLFISPHRSVTTNLPDYPDRFIGLSLDKSPEKHPPKRKASIITSWFKNIGFDKNKLLAIDGSIDLQGLRTILQKWGATNRNTIFISNFLDNKSRALFNFFYSLKYKIIYRHVDWWDLSHKIYGYDPSVLPYACSRASLITISHPDLLLNLPRFGQNKVLKLTNGIDLEIFHPAMTQADKPQDLIMGKITIGFWGSFWGDRIDWPLITSLALKNPDWHFNLIGDIEYRNIDPVLLPMNVHFLGFKKKNELKPYLLNFDLCIIPYRQDMPFAKYSNPIKALESLSALKPVVTPTNLSLKDYPGIFFYSSESEAEEMIQTAYRTKLDQELILSFLLEHTWQRKAELMLDKLGHC